MEKNWLQQVNWKKKNLTVYSSHVTNAFIQAAPYLLRIEILRRVNIFQKWETN